MTWVGTHPFTNTVLKHLCLEDGVDLAHSTLLYKIIQIARESPVHSSIQVSLRFSVGFRSEQKFGWNFTLHLYHRPAGFFFFTFLSRCSCSCFNVAVPQQFSSCHCVSFEERPALSEVTMMLNFLHLLKPFIVFYATYNVLEIILAISWDDIVP